MARTPTLGVLVAALLLLTAQRTSSQSPLDVAPAWGEALSGVRIGIARTTPSSSTPAFTVILHNSGKGRVFIDLGALQMTRGRGMSPSAIRLILTDSLGNARELRFVDWCSPALSGPPGGFTLPLPAGASYSLPVSLNRDWTEMPPRLPGGRLPAGRYQIRARLEGGDRKVDSGLGIDVDGVFAPIPLPLWRGTLHSGAVEFELPEALSTSSGDVIC